jgi:hypothetical protein
MLMGSAALICRDHRHPIRTSQLKPAYLLGPEVEPITTPHSVPFNCLAKRQYATCAIARRVATRRNRSRKMHDLPQRLCYAYRCGRCDFWHVDVSRKHL